MAADFTVRLPPPEVAWIRPPRRAALIAGAAQAGINPKAIAGHLNLSPGTVHVYLSLARRRGAVVPGFKRGRKLSACGLEWQDCREPGAADREFHRALSRGWTLEAFPAADADGWRWLVHHRPEEGIEWPAAHGAAAGCGAAQMAAEGAWHSLLLDPHPASAAAGEPGND
jgi:hypothetical protein